MEIIFGLIVLIFSAILHEVAHGYVADRLGDPTARLMGRLTLNPLKHIDPYLSVILPALLILSGSPIIFGGAKPVPVDPFNLKEGRKDMALVSLAGPGTNIALAVIAAVILRAFPFLTGGLVGMFLITVVNYNLLLAIFNLIPIPPLDGSKIFSLVLPEKEARMYMSLETVGMFILFFLLLFPVGGFSLSRLIFSLFTLAHNLLGV
ncbi:MAG TPA: site-2 protease family protein [Patescibacteria group bacterium]